MPEHLKAALESAHVQIGEAHANIQTDPIRTQAHALLAIADLLYALTHEALDVEAEEHA